jgi:outer membrane protein assembly factor BamD (BamD/ComL family)
MISETNKSRCLLVFSFLVLAGCAGREVLKTQGSPPDPAKQIFAQAAGLFEKGEYDRAAEIYSRFLERYPSHAYADDAAYRLAYIRVTANPDNPLLDYEKARTLFQKFIETYQNSRYISACTNWLAVLQSRPGKQTPSSQESREVVQLRQQISDLQTENQKLKTTLAELQQAIER